MPKVLKIVEGWFYYDKTGILHGPMKPHEWGDKGYVWESESDGNTYTLFGHFIKNCRSGFDLVAPLQGPMLDKLKQQICKLNVRISELHMVNRQMRDALKAFVPRDNVCNSGATDICRSALKAAEALARKEERREHND